MDDNWGYPYDLGTTILLTIINHYKPSLLTMVTTLNVIIITMGINSGY